MGDIVGDAQKHHAARNGRKAKKSQNRAFHLPVGGQPSTTHGSNKLHCSKWHIKQDCVESVEAKRLDNQRTEGGDTAAWNAVMWLIFCKLLALTGNPYEMVNIKANHSQDFRSMQASLT